ncbi:LOW QUALITY PROTEIN: hypothetical protein JCM24511_01599 [Saitozyma sp. JCM 24511]|nr:LOW QUALITY PROTEIN: hypothetical protein JCM24511_01599 [Saitozyma sp. JCM 24511]
MAAAPHEPLKPRAQDTLIRGIIDLVSTHRKELYKFPGLLGEVDDHGSDRIKKKVEQLMRGLGGGAGLGTGSGSGKGIIGAGTQEGGGERKRRKAEVAELTHNLILHPLSARVPRTESPQHLLELLVDRVAPVVRDPLEGRGGVEVTAVRKDEVDRRPEEGELGLGAAQADRDPSGQVWRSAKRRSGGR